MPGAWDDKLIITSKVLSLNASWYYDHLEGSEQRTEDYSIIWNLLIWGIKAYRTLVVIELRLGRADPELGSRSLGSHSLYDSEYLPLFSGYLPYASTCSIPYHAW